MSTLPPVRKATYADYFAPGTLPNFIELLVSSRYRHRGYTSIKAFHSDRRCKMDRCILRDVNLATVQNIPKAPKICHSCQYWSLSTPSRLSLFIPFLFLELLIVRRLCVPLNMSITTSWCSIYRAFSLLEPAGRYFGGICLSERIVK
jgi:hypothetical protein